MIAMIAVGPIVTSFVLKKKGNKFDKDWEIIVNSFPPAQEAIDEAAKVGWVESILGRKSGYYRIGNTLRHHILQFEWKKKHISTYLWNWKSSKRLSSTTLCVSKMDMVAPVVWRWGPRWCQRSCPRRATPWSTWAAMSGSGFGFSPFQRQRSIIPCQCLLD